MKSLGRNELFTSLSSSTLIITGQSAWDSLAAELKKSVHQSDWWENDRQKPLTMREVRDLHHFAEHTPVTDTKIISIFQADLLKAEPANALLKLLEEPPSYLKLVLFAESSQLLPTLLSRLRIIYLTDVGASGSEFGQWQQLLEAYDVSDEGQRKQMQDILYLLPLLHGGIQQGLVREAFTPGK